VAIRKLITFHLFECSLIFIHTHFPIFVYAHSIIHNLLYLIGNSVGETPHTFWNVVLYCRQWELMLNASLKWWDNEDGSLYMIGSKAHLFLTPYHIFCINTIVNFVAGIKALCKPLSMQHTTSQAIVHHCFLQTATRHEFLFWRVHTQLNRLPYLRKLPFCNRALNHTTSTHAPIFFPRSISLTAVDSFFPRCSPQKQSFQHVQKECSTLNIHVPQRYPILTCAHFRFN
jgi:hypothetical protein